MIIRQNEDFQIEEQDEFTAREQKFIGEYDKQWEKSLFTAETMDMSTHTTISIESTKLTISTEPMKNSKSNVFEEQQNHLNSNIVIRLHEILLALEKILL